LVPALPAAAKPAALPFSVLAALPVGTRDSRFDVRSARIRGSCGACARGRLFLYGA